MIILCICTHIYKILAHLQPSYTEQLIILRYKLFKRKVDLLSMSQCLYFASLVHKSSVSTGTTNLRPLGGL